MSKFSNFTIKQMLECGVHFGHKSMLWNPKMASYIYCERNGVHIINLQKTAQLLHNALYLLYNTMKTNPKAKVLFVGTKHQASPLVKEYAMSCGQYFVNHRWLGGMLTNWGTVSKSIKKLSDYEKLLLDATNAGGKYNKKELLEVDRSRERLDRSLGGIRDMQQKPDLIFIIDTNKEKIAVQEAKKLGIPVMAILDTNSNVENVDYPIPGNDDSTKSIDLYCALVSKAILSGLEDFLIDSGVDPNEAEARVREAIDKDNNKHEERSINFNKVQEAKAKREAEKVPQKRIIEVVNNELSSDKAKKEVVKKNVETKKSVTKKVVAEKEVAKKSAEKKTKVKANSEEKVSAKKTTGEKPEAKKNNSSKEV